ncbi:MAG: HEAT repeat domain-containing protein [Planctomycetes bacterium]|nr:HEAT repeat domain-containing protein [Planctomycetota bacterium]
MTQLLAAALLLCAQDFSDEVLQSVRKLRVPKGLKVELFAAEPQFVNPVAFSIDEKGRFFVAETHRRHSSVLEVWDRREWLDDDLAARRVEDRVALYRKRLGAAADKLSADSERNRLIEDLGGKGRADFAATFAEGFNALADGLGSGVLARGSEVWYTCAPNLWHLTVGPDGKASARKLLHFGFGVHMGSGAHDLHGLCFGPDGKIYFSMGDRGYHVTAGGQTYDSPDMGGVLRCNPDGSDLEVFATGLRNPEQLCFDDRGNLWTGDNNSDAGDKARWVWVVEGGDSGWRFGYQREVLKSPWMIERLWEIESGRTAPSQAPPAGYVGHGPSGIAFNPGSGLNDAYRDHFFMADFPGAVRSFAVKPKGAGFVVVDDKEFLGELWPTDVKFGPDGALYVSDWVQGWAKPGKGRIFRVFDPAAPADDTRTLLADGMAARAPKALHDLLAHRDLRVRQAAQFELAARKKDAILAAAAHSGSGLARLHGIWGLGQLRLAAPLVPLLRDPDAEVRAQAAKVLGDLRSADGLLPLLKDESPRVRLFAALALGKCRQKEAVAPILSMLRDNDDQDPFVRHAGVAALAWIGDVEPLPQDPSAAVRLASLLALRRLERKEVELFLDDADPRIALEAARAIHDVPIPAAAPALIRMLGKPGLNDRIYVRAVNAALREGALQPLQSFIRKIATPALRVDALEALAEWEHPPGRDRVMGLWRPVPARTLDAAQRDAVDNILMAEITDEKDDAARVQAIRAWAALRLGSQNNIIRGLFREAHWPSAVRVEALRAMGEVKDPEAAAAVTAALDDKDAALREEAVKLLVRLRLPDTSGLLEKLAKEKGALGVRQAAVTSLGDWPGPEADAIVGRLLDQWNELPAGLQLEVLEAAGKRLPSRTIDRRIPNGELLEGGDAKAGREIFFDRLDVACARCHAVKDKGGTVGPPLTTVGKQKTCEQILDSILFPNKEIAQGYGQWLLQMEDGAIEVGRIEKESDAEILLLLADGNRKTLAKASVKARKAGLSAMPDDISKALSRRDLRDLVAYLSGLR